MTQTYQRLPCPYPTVDASRELHDGYLLDQSRDCVRCKPRSCVAHAALAGIGEARHAVCEFGYSVVSLGTALGNILINGIFVTSLNAKRGAKKLDKPRRIPMEVLQKIATRLSGAAQAIHDAEARLRSEIDLAMESKVADAIAGLHDIQTASNLVFRNTEAFLHARTGRHLADGLDLEDKALMRIAKSVLLLRSRFSMASIVANPKAAKYGQLRPGPIHRICFKIVQLFSEQAEGKRVGLRMVGVSENRPNVFESFETIPMVLVDNAIKYSEVGTDILVRVEDSGAGCILSVESTGPLVPDAAKAHLFERGYRAPGAVRSGTGGSGLGLYIAQVVAQVHETEVVYTGLRQHALSASGRNVFSVRIGIAKGSQA